MRMRMPAGIDRDSELLRKYRDCSCDRKNLGLKNK